MIDTPTLLAIAACALGIALGFRVILLKKLGLAEGRGPSETREAQRTSSRGRATQLLKQLGQLLPIAAEKADSQRNKLAQAGFRFELDQWQGTRIAWAGACLLLAAALLLQGPNAGRIFLIIVVILLGIFGPRLLLTSLARDRRRKLDQSLASTLELLSIAVKSGYPLERGIKLIGQMSKGPLADEFKQVDMDVNLLGMGLEQALTRMRARCDTPAISSFTAAITQAHKQGVSVSRVLDSQARIARNEHYAQLKEQVNKLPAKLVAPIFVIMMLIVVIALVPPVYDTVQIFTGSYSSASQNMSDQTSAWQ